MTKTQLLSTAAMALLIGSGAVSAQTQEPKPERAPPALQNAPPAKIAPPINAGERKTPGTIGQAPKSAEPSPGRSAAPAASVDSKAKAETAASPGKTEMKGEADSKGSAGLKENSDSKAAADTQKSSPTARQSTTGQGAAAGAAKLSTEQRTKITTVIRQQKVQPVNLNVTVRVGTRVPPSVRFYPLPTEVVTIYPEWRGYLYILVGNEIVVVEPSTHEIVAILAV